MYMIFETIMIAWLFTIYMWKTYLTVHTLMVNNLQIIKHEMGNNNEITHTSWITEFTQFGLPLWVRFQSRPSLLMLKYLRFTMTFFTCCSNAEMECIVGFLAKNMQNEYTVLENPRRDLLSCFMVYLKVYVPLGMHFETILCINVCVQPRSMCPLNRARPLN